MKLRKLLALVLALSVCVSVMAPMASAAYEGKSHNIIIVAPSPTDNGDGTADVTLTATVNMNTDEVAKTVASYITSGMDKLADVRFVCGLSGNNIGVMAGNDFSYELNDVGQELFVKDTSKTDGAQNDNLIHFYLKFNPTKIQEWKNLTGTVEEIKEAVAADLGREISFTASRSGVEVSYGTIYAYVDVFLGSSTYAERIAYGSYVLTSPGNTGYVDEPTPEEPTPTPTPGEDETPEIEQTVIDENGNEVPADKPAAEVINSLEVSSVDPETGKTVKEAPKTGQTANFAFKPNYGIIAHNGGKSQIAVKILDSMGRVLFNSLDALIKALTPGATAGTSAGAVVTVDENGETVVSFVMPEDGVEFVVEYVSVPYTPEETGVNSLLNTEDHIAYIKGDGTGSFRPNDKITRAELATMIYRLLRDKNVETTVSFNDVQEGTWYYDAVMALASLGIIKGAYGQFRPFDTITREEATAICARFATKQPDVVGKEFADVSSADWAHDEIALASALNWVIGYPDGNFKPDNALTRAEAVTLLNRVLGRPGDAAAINAGKGASFSDVQSNYWYTVAIVEASTAHEYTMDEATYTETWAN